MCSVSPAQMSDIFLFAKDSFLESYSYFSEEEYDEMVREFFRETYTKEEVEQDLPMDEYPNNIQNVKWDIERKLAMRNPKMWDKVS